MKRILLTFGVLCLSCFPSLRSDAQGNVSFNNYGGLATDAKVYNGDYVGVGLDNSFTAQLYYAFGTVTWDDSTVGNWDDIPNTFIAASATAPFAGPGSNGSGYFDGGVVTIPGYFAGPITFMLVAYTRESYGISPHRAHSEPFTLPSIATGVAPPSELGAGLVSFTAYYWIPEPTSGSIFCLGWLSLWLLRRASRKS